MVIMAEQRDHKEGALECLSLSITVPDTPSGLHGITEMSSAMNCLHLRLCCLEGDQTSMQAHLHSNYMSEGLWGRGEGLWGRGVRAGGGGG